MNIDYRLWPNADGNLGNIKVQIPTGIGDDKWPEGDALVGNFVYKDGKLAGFVDTKALTANDAKSTTINYDYVNIHLDSIKEGDITFNRGERSKYFTVTYGSGSSVESFDFVIIDFNTTDQETINTVRTAKKVVDNKLYDADGDLIGTWDTSKIEVGGIFDMETMRLDGLFYNLEADGETERGLILSEFDSDLSSLKDGSLMFNNCYSLTSFTSDLSSLTNGNIMFDSCKLDTASVQNIADTIKDVSSLINGSIADDEVYKLIYIGIGNSTPNEQEEVAFNTIASKGWTVFVNGVEYTPTSPAAITILHENGEETVTPIPFWAKPVPSDEEHAHYVDTNGSFFNILGGQFIYGDDISTYGMFTCEEDAAANMKLTKIEKPSISKFALKH